MRSRRGQQETASGHSPWQEERTWHTACLVALQADFRIFCTPVAAEENNSNPGHTAPVTTALNTGPYSRGVQLSR